MMTRAVGTLSPGTLLYQGRYRIDLLLATTPHRAIYRAWNLARGRASTIIELAPTTDPLATRALERAAPLVQLDHPALTAFQVVFVEQETVFIGMAFAGGQLVERIMDERITPIQPAAAVRWISQAAEMLEFFASALPTWHLGDISPSALFVTVEDRTQLLGFEGPLGLLTPSDIAADLPSGAVAPELHDGQCDARSDVYALAASLYLLLTRQRWQGGDPATETALSANEPPLPQPLIDAVRRGLARDPAQRWRDAAAFNSALLAAMAAPADASHQEWWASMPAEPESDTQEINRSDLFAAATAQAATAAADADLATPPESPDPALADPNTTLDRVPSHIFTDAAADDVTTKQAAVTLPTPDAPSTQEDAAPAVTDAVPTPPAEEDASIFSWFAAPMITEAPQEVTPSAPLIHPSVLDSLAAASGEIDPHGLEDMQPIDHTVTPPSADEPVSTPTHDEPVTDEVPTAIDTGSGEMDAAEVANDSPNAAVTNEETPPSETHTPWGWAAAGALGVAGVAGIAAATRHPEASEANDDGAIADSTATTEAETHPPAEVAPPDAPSTNEPAPQPTWADETFFAPSPMAIPPAPPSDTTEAVDVSDEPTSTPETPERVFAPYQPTDYRWPWEDEPVTPQATQTESDASASVPAAIEEPAAPVALVAEEESSASSVTPPPDTTEADQLSAWSRFASTVAPLTLTEAANAFAGADAAKATSAPEPVAPFVEPEPVPVAPLPEPEETAPVPPTTPSPFVGQSISAHAERHEPNIPPPSAKSKTPSRPLGNNNFFNRLRDLLGTPAEPSAAIGTVVLPRHMYPQHSYSILVRLQTRPTTNSGSDTKRMAIIEVEAPANAFYLPVRRLALPIPPEGGLSEGTLAITALRTSAGTADRVIFTFKQSDGTVLHKGSYIADVTILTAQQVANGDPMITLVHPLDIPV